MASLEELSDLMQRGRAKLVKEMTQTLLDEGVGAKQILDTFLSAMNIVGVKFKNNEVFVPEVLVTARAMNAGVELLKPYMGSEDQDNKGTVVVGTVEGDLHDIGKNLVVMMMKGKGLNVIDLGVDVPPQKFVDAAIENNADAVCCSALLTTTMPVMEKVVELIRENNLQDKVKVMIGGAPVTQDFCDKIKADVYTTDATSAAERAVEVCTKK